jgi:hypothetical protein
METTPVELIQAPGGKYRLVAGERKIGSDGTQAWYGGLPLTDEPMAMFGRLGRTWVGETDFAGLSRPAVTGKDTVGKSEAVVVQGFRTATASAEELYFDAASKLLSRLVNIRRSTVGTVVSAIDYLDYRKVGSAQVPMKVNMMFAEGPTWSFDFKTAKIEPTVDEKIFKSAG